MLKNPFIVGLIIFVLAGISVALAWGDQQLILVYIFICALYYLVATIAVLIAAFRESIGTGLLTLFLPFYILYFVLAVCESAWVKMMFGTSIVAYVLGVVMMASSGSFDPMGAP